MRLWWLREKLLLGDGLQLCIHQFLQLSVAKFLERSVVDEKSQGFLDIEGLGVGQVPGNDLRNGGIVDILFQMFNVKARLGKKLSDLFRLG